MNNFVVIILFMSIRKRFPATSDTALIPVVAMLASLVFVSVACITENLVAISADP